MSLSDRVRYWKESALRDKKTAETLYKNGDYHWCLFFWHLVLEKLLKALILSQKKELVYTHNIAIFAQSAAIPLTQKEEMNLKEITSFNLEARYDDEKLSFYKKANQSYTNRWIAVCNTYADQWEKLI